MEKESFSLGFKLEDSEIAGYICSKKETEARKLMWEILHTDYLNRKRSDRSVKSKNKIPPSKKSMKVSSNQKETTKMTGRLSSKINYDAIKKLMEDDDGESEEKSTGNQIGGDNKSDVNEDYDDAFDF